MSFKAQSEETDGPKNGTWNQYSDYKWFITKETLVNQIISLLHQMMDNQPCLNFNLA